MTTVTSSHMYKVWRAWTVGLEVTVYDMDIRVAVAAYHFFPGDSSTATHQFHSLIRSTACSTHTSALPSHFLWQERVWAHISSQDRWYAYPRSRAGGNTESRSLVLSMLPGLGKDSEEQEEDRLKKLEEEKWWKRKPTTWQKSMHG